MLCTIHYRRIEIYKDEALEDKVATWDEASGKFTVSYDGNSMNIAMTADGLDEINSANTVHTSGINSGYSDCIMAIRYSAKLKSDTSVVYGSTGNPNTVTLTWKRTNADYSDTLEDSAVVYTYGIDLTKKFSDGKGDISKVKFIIENNTDVYLRWNSKHRRSRGRGFQGSLRKYRFPQSRRPSRFRDHRCSEFPDSPHLQDGCS